MAAPILTRRALNRATLARQMLLERSTMPILDAVEHLVGLQAQTPQTWYTGMWSRLVDFRAEGLSDLLAERRVVRMALLRSTIHLVSAADAWRIRPLLQAVQDRGFQGAFGKRVDGLDREAVVRAGHAIVDQRPITFKDLGDRLTEHWPDRDPLALSQLIRTAVPLVQVPPRGLWGRSGPAAHTSMEAWLGGPSGAATTVDHLVLRYLAAFGPASVMDAQTWCGLTRLRDVFERLRPTLVGFRDESGHELFDLPDAPRPDPDTPAPPRFLYDYDNVLLSHADRSRLVAPDDVPRLAPDPQLIVSIFLVDGVGAGTWRVEHAGSSATLDLRPLAPLSPTDVSALTEEGERLLTFLAPRAAETAVRLRVD